MDGVFFWRLDIIPIHHKKTIPQKKILSILKKHTKKQI